MKYKLIWADDTLIDYTDEADLSAKLAEMGYTEKYMYKVGKESIEITAWWEMEAQSDYEAIGMAVVYIKNHIRAIDWFKLINNDEITIYEQ